VQGFPDTINVPIMETEVLCTINSMKKNNSSGYDEISNKLLKLCAQYISKPLAYIYNSAINLGSFPDHLKYSVVVPVYKNGDKSLTANYRPISLVTSFFQNI
jgi:hypothetical protein